ncbi:MAG: hypothetical protein ABIY40_06240 [Rhodanobacteraceae bacterium]
MFGKVTASPDGSSWTITVAWNGLVDISGVGNTDTSESVIFIPAKL